jgi:2-oxoglutarate ferredoxin oxidoreductase subunit beta
MAELTNTPLKAKDFASNQDIKWCPGCGDYSILKQVQSIMPEIGVAKKDIVFISGIGCSSRFPYYMDTYGLHSIHGRAPAFATGLKASRPDLSVWMVTGDGDALSIGGNHLIHLLRRNVDINVLLFNNEIYGLTKGQYSPASELGKVTKSSPMGSIDHPFNPLKLCLGADATFVARSMDRDPKHLRVVLSEASKHKGTSMVEIYQNCNIFNDMAFGLFTEKESKKKETIFVEHGQPLIFGENDEKGIVLDGFKPKVVDLEKDGVAKENLWIHDETDAGKASLLVQFFDDPRGIHNVPRPFGVFYKENRHTYNDDVRAQLDFAVQRKGKGDLDALLKGTKTWEIS